VKYMFFQTVGNMSAKDKDSRTEICFPVGKRYSLPGSVSRTIGFNNPACTLIFKVYFPCHIQETEIPYTVVGEKNPQLFIHFERSKL
jgi:hypothetical protein